AHSQFLAPRAIERWRGAAAFAEPTLQARGQPPAECAGARRRCHDRLFQVSGDPRVIVGLLRNARSAYAACAGGGTECARSVRRRWVGESGADPLRRMIGALNAEPSRGPLPVIAGIE